MQPTWITSLTSISPIVLPILNKIKPKRICEVGSAAGEHSKVLHAFLQGHQGELIMIDPSPRGPFLSWANEAGESVKYIAEFSLTGIPKVNADVWFVDGDHNWYTVYHELLLIDQQAKLNQSPALIYLHDVGWPCARRDMYYNPQSIPVHFVQPYAPAEHGITLEQAPHIKGLLKGPYWAVKEGGPRNGVLTAVEDFVKTSGVAKYHWMRIPAMLGLGVLVDVSHPHAQQILDYYAPYHENPVMALMEENRIINYIASIASKELVGV